MPCVSGQLFTPPQINVHIPFVKDIGNIGEMVFLASELNLMLDDRFFILIWVPETRLILHCILIDLILGQSHIVLEDNKEWNL